MKGTWFQYQVQEAPTFCRATQQESRTAEAPCPKQVLCNKRIHPSERPIECNEERLHLPTAGAQPRSSEDPAQPSVNQSIKFKEKPDNQTRKREY